MPRWLRIVPPPARCQSRSPCALPPPRLGRWSLAAAAALLAARKAVVEPSKRRRRARAAEAVDAEGEAREAVDARAAAVAEARLMAREAAQRAQAEVQCGGLLVLAAFYGDVTAALQAVEGGEARGGGGGGATDGGATGSGAAGSATGGGGADGEQCGGDGAGGGGEEAWLDVRIALQFAVTDSSLELPARSKCTLRGFAPIAPVAAGVSAFQCELWVRYQLGVEVRTVRVDDLEPLQIGMLRSRAAASSTGA